MYEGIKINIPLEESEKLELYEGSWKEIETGKRKERFENCGVPMKFFNASFDTFEVENQEQKENLNKVQQFAVAPKNRVLILSGNNGTGKTHLGVSVLTENEGLFRTSENICIEYDSASDFHSKLTRLEVLKKYISVKMLVIDECGKYTIRQDLERFLLSYIVRNRYENNLPTVLITNGEIKEFIEFLGKAVYDRLVEVCTTVTFRQKSLRGKFRLVVGEVKDNKLKLEGAGNE